MTEKKNNLRDLLIELVGLSRQREDLEFEDRALMALEALDDYLDFEALLKAGGRPIPSPKLDKEVCEAHLKPQRYITINPGLPTESRLLVSWG